MLNQMEQSLFVGSGSIADSTGPIQYYAVVLLVSTKLGVES
jgi:hypothetical protein